MSLQGGVSACLDLLARCCDAANNGRWQRLAAIGDDYMTAFEQLKSEIDRDGPGNEEDLLVMQKLEHEQRKLIRLVRQRQEAVQEQLQALGDARRRLHRVRDMTQVIEEGRL